MLVFVYQPDQRLPSTLPTLQLDAARLVDVAGRQPVEDLVLVVGAALEGADLVVPARHEAGDGLEAVSVCQAGESLQPTLGHHAGQVWALGPLRRTGT